MSAQLSIVPRLKDTQASEDIVEVLRALIKEAEAGEIVGGAFAIYDRGRNGFSTIVAGENPTLLMGQLGMLQHRLAKYIDL